jgi:putative two-component system response regulator
MVALALAVPTVVVLLGVLATRHRRVEDEIGRYYDVSRELLATIDLRGRFIRVNSAWVRALGHSAESMCSRELIELVHCEERASVRAEIDATADGTQAYIESCNRFRAADGKYRWLAWEASALCCDAVIHVAAHDITERRTAQQQLANSARCLEKQIAERTHELEQARAETLQLLASVAEHRDDQSCEHTERVGLIAAEIAVRLGLRVEQIRRLREAAGLHDIGKIALPDRILLKPGSLNAEEQRMMETHAAVGARLLSRSSSPVLQMAAVIAATHHEWWNGSGYPSGLVGERIPLVGRVVAVADAFDALTHERAYMPASPVGEAIARIRRASGSQFDPRVVAAFLAVYSDAQLTIMSAGGRDSRLVTAPRRGRSEALR